MKIAIREETIEYYVRRLKTASYFALVGYSDAEWYCVLKYELGKATGLGQILHGYTGDKLLEVLKRRHEDSDFLFATPKVLWTMNDCITAGIGPRIENLLSCHDIEITFFERDIVTDSLASMAGLFPFIDQLRRMNTVIIGPKELQGLDFLGYSHFVKIESPNLHLRPGGVTRAVSDCMAYGKPAVYLVSAGVSAALIIDQLYNQLPQSFFIDCGSIWDAFVGIGGQREWRKRLYARPEKLEQWKRDNLRQLAPEEKKVWRAYGW